MKKHNNWLLFLLLGLSLVLGISIAFRNQTALIRFFSTDDAFYYFVVAQNISEGQGITFDGIARGNGYHPLWMLVCIPVFALARFDLWLPLRVLVVLQAVMHAATGYFIYQWLRKKASQPLSLLAMAVWLFSTTIFTISGSKGLETGINLLCLSALLYFLSTWSDKPKKEIAWKHYLVTGILAALTLMARLDNIYLLSFIGAWLVLKDSRLNRAWIFVDFFLAAFGVIFGYFQHVGFTDPYYSMMPQIKILIVASMVVYPLGQFLAGVYHLDNAGNRRKTTLLRIGIGAVGSAILLAGAMLVLHPQGGYSRVALVIQAVVFVILSIIAKLFIPVFKENPTEPVAQQPGYRLRQIFALDWIGLIGKAAGYFGPLFGALGVFLAFNHFYFGAAMPLSGQIKEWWGSLSTVYGNLPRTLLPFLGLHDKGPWNFITKFIRPLTNRIQVGLSPDLTLVAVMGLIAFAVLAFYFASQKMQERVHAFAFQPLTLGIIFHACYYTMTGYVGYRGWYWTVERLYILLLGVLLVDALIAHGVKRWPQLRKPWLGWGLAGAGMLALVAVFIRFNLRTFPFTPRDETPYLHNTRMLEQCTESGTLIGMTGGGVEGYFIQDRTIVNMDGLINGIDYFTYLTDMRLDEYLDQIGVDYVFGKYTMVLNSEPYMAPLNGRLVEYDPDGCSYDDSLVLYKFVPEQ